MPTSFSYFLVPKSAKLELRHGVLKGESLLKAGGEDPAAPRGAPSSRGGAWKIRIIVPAEGGRNKPNDRFDELYYNIVCIIFDRI